MQKLKVTDITYMFMYLLKLLTGSACSLKGKAYVDTKLQHLRVVNSFILLRLCGCVSAMRPNLLVYVLVLYFDNSYYC